MVDNLKIFISDYNPYYDKIFYYYHGENLIEKKEFYKRTEFNKRHEKKMFPLQLLLTVNYKLNKLSLSIRGSLRKWYFQENSNRDFNYDEFLDCLKLLAEAICIPFDLLLKSKINKLELGANILLKSKMKNIIHCFQKYRNADREIYKKTTLYFHFKNYKLVFYDKFLEIKKK